MILVSVEEEEEKLLTNKSLAPRESVQCSLKPPWWATALWQLLLLLWTLSAASTHHPQRSAIRKPWYPTVEKQKKKHDSNLHLEDRLQICTPARLWELQFYYSALLRELRLRGKPEADEILLQPGYHSKSCKKVATQPCTTRGDWIWWKEEEAVAAAGARSEKLNSSSTAAAITNDRNVSLRVPRLMSLTRLGAAS